MLESVLRTGDVLETERLWLRHWREADEDPMCAINQDSEVMAYFPELQDRATTLRFFEKVRTHFAEHGYGLWAVEEKSSGEFIGFIGLMAVDFEAHFTPAVEIGWRLASSHWRRGLATEGASAVLRYAFTALDLDEIVSFTSVDNKASRRVMEKIGLQRGVADDFDHPQLPDGHVLRAHVLYRLKCDDCLGGH
jgi:RimJ/RimL family protein N-acetyltransferase